MKKRSWKKRSVMSALVAGVVALGSTTGAFALTEIRNETESYSSEGYEYSVIAFTPAHIDLSSWVDDSWETRYTYVGYPNTNNEQYCTITVGLDDGFFSNSDYMWTGNALKKCDVATFIYVQGYVKNSEGSYSSTSPYVTNSQSTTTVSVSHPDPGASTYYVRFRG